MTTPLPRRGDRYILPPPPPRPMYVEVVRVAADGTWADLRIHWYGTPRSVRRPLPLPDLYTPSEWTDSDVESRDSSDEPADWAVE